MRIFTAASVAVAALLLTACGSAATPTPTGSATGGTEPGAFPVTIAHQFGSTTITAAPKRVVTVGLVEQDALLALGIVPVGVTNWFGNAPGRIFDWAKPKLGGGALPEVLGSETEFEKVAALKPDLIIALYAGIKQKDYDLLSAIAPTVAHPAGQNDYTISWQDLTRTVGKAVGQPATAAKLVTDVEARIAQARQQYPQFGGERALMVTPYEGIFVYGPEDIRARLLSDLGFTFPSNLTSVAESAFGASISVENADQIDVDVLIWLGTKDAVNKAVPTYAQLNVARTDHAIYIAENNDDPFYIATSFVTVLSLPYLLDKLLPMLSDAVAGKATT